jgi:hypothetical protein
VALPREAVVQFGDELQGLLGEYFVVSLAHGAGDLNS